MAKVSGVRSAGRGCRHRPGPWTRQHAHSRRRPQRIPGAPLCARRCSGAQRGRPQPSGPLTRRPGGSGSAWSLSNSGRGAGEQRLLAAPAALKGCNAGRPLAAIYSPFIPLACAAGWYRCFVLRPQPQTTPPPQAAHRVCPLAGTPAQPAYPARRLPRTPKPESQALGHPGVPPLHRGKLRQESHPALDARVLCIPAPTLLCQYRRWRPRGAARAAPASAAGTAPAPPRAVRAGSEPPTFLKVPEGISRVILVQREGAPEARSGSGPARRHLRCRDLGQVPRLRGT